MPVLVAITNGTVGTKIKNGSGFHPQHDTTQDGECLIFTFIF